MLHSGQSKRVFWLVQTMTFFPPSENVFFNECFNPAIGDVFSLWWKPSTQLERSFLLAESVTDMSGNHFLKTDLALAGGNSFSSQWKPLSSIVSDTFQEVLHPDQWNHILHARGKVLFFTQKSFYCQRKPLFKLQRSLFKTLVTAIDNDFL